MHCYEPTMVLPPLGYPEPRGGNFDTDSHMDQDPNDVKPGP